MPNVEYLSSNNLHELPNIILITADGLDAQHMSAYGYSRDTTPNIQKLLKNSLVAENAFTNAGNTAGSIISIYTGKYPTDTRVLFAPDILKNQNTTEHLLSILQEVNYSSTQFSYPYYADAYDLNLRSGFNFANGRTMESTQFINFFSKYLDSNQSYFIYQIIIRLIDRLSHIFYVKDMVNLSSLAEGNSLSFNDQYKFDSAIKILEQSDKPIFIHIHCMETHGPLFYPKSANYSAHKEANQQNEYDIDFYDDSILDFDNSVGQLIEKLKMDGTFDNTILIIGSDHGQRFTTNKKLPLIIHFPNNDYSGKIISNVQNIDIGPTILDYIGISKPDWMSGHSLLKLTDKSRPIISFTIGQFNQEGDDIFASNNKPPFYQFGYINFIYCDNYYRLTFEGKKWESGTIEGHIGQCDSITDEQAYQLMVEHLEKYNFDVSTLKSYSFVNKLKE
ncbi:MAG: sulfatase-like hydrolase/transferase [Anaerolineae bacterium]|nr:sulfatase-like hydrolase/transferase [Anaerolineae bacterium]